MKFRPLCRSALLTFTFVAASLAVAPSRGFAQGLLTPPGAPGPTMKTLDQIEPRIDVQRTVNPLPTDSTNHYRINAPGSYYLSANLAVTKTNGIVITVSGVTLDLNGFQISRASGAGGAGVLISVIPPATRFTIQNGTVTGFASGVTCDRVGGELPRGGTYSRLVASNCSFVGLDTGEAWEVLDCQAVNNTGVGISVESGTLRNCVAANNTGNVGITAGTCTLEACQAINNGGGSSSSTAGISVGDGSTLSGCTASGNTAFYAIQTGDGCSVSGCVARANTSAAASSYGIYTGAGGHVTACVASANASSSGSLTANTGVGIHVGTDSTVRDCTVQGNTGDGIQLTSQGAAIGNTCDSNGAGSGDGAGVHATGNANRIEANHATANDRGITVDGTGNLILRNSARNSVKNYVLAAGNRFGPIVDTTLTTAAAVSGSSAASTLSATADHPWANFSH